MQGLQSDRGLVHDLDLKIEWLTELPCTVKHKNGYLEERVGVPPDLLFLMRKEAEAQAVYGE